MSTTDQFNWTSPDGVKITLPYLGKISAGLIRKTRKLNNFDALFTVIEEVTTKAMLAKIDALTAEQLDDMFEAWQAAASLGESESSSE